jgi:hypothetical protein
MLELWSRSHGRPIPRTKALVSEVTAQDPALGEMVHRFALAASPTERLQAAQQIGDRVLQSRGFFEWDSGPEPMSPVTGSASSLGDA